MKMTKLEKRFVNRRKKAEHNISKIRTALEKIESKRIKNVLEVGCGMGLVSFYLANEYGFNVYGTDFDPEEIELAKKFNKRCPNLYYQREDTTSLSFRDNSFDLVLSQNVFHHIPNWQKAVAEIQRVLRPEGYLIWLDLLFPALLKKMFSPISKNYGLYTLNEILFEFDKAGFNILQKQKFWGGPFKHYQIILTTD